MVWWSALWLWVTIPPLVAASTFSSWNVTAPNQCSNFTLAWTSGGTPPYEVTLVAIYGPGYNPVDLSGPGVIDMNATAPNEWSTVLRYPMYTAFVFVVSDETGFGSGGTSSVLFVGNSSDSSCLGTDNAPGIDFTFAMTALKQCQSSNFTFTGTVEPPISILAILPVLSGGMNQGLSSFELFEVNSTTLEAAGAGSQYDVSLGPLRLPAESRPVLVVGDQRGRASGGWSQLYQVAYSPETDCLGSASQATTSPSASATTTPSSGTRTLCSWSTMLASLFGTSLMGLFG